MQRYLPYGAGVFLILFLALAWVVSSVPIATTSFDSVVHGWIVPLQTAGGIQLFQAITFFGGAVGVVLGVFATTWFFRHRPDVIARLWVAIIGSSASVEYLKVLFHRARPETISGLIIPNTFSFPSGHSTSAMVLYGFVALLLYVHSKNRIQKILSLIVPALLILLVGLSRLVLEYHYPSDVLGGFLFGALWLTFVLSVPLARGLYHDRHKVKSLV